MRAIERVESCRIYDNSELRLFQHVLTTEKAKLVHVDWGLVSRRPALEELVSDIRSRLGA